MTPSELLVLLFKCSNNTITIDLACPALSPPAGELPLDPDAPSLWSISLGILVACSVLVTACVALRIFTRTRIVKRFFTLEDALVIASAVLFVPIVGLQLKAYGYGGSKHQWNVTVGDLFIALRYVYAVQIIYCLALYAAKLSILLQIKHIFEITQQRKVSVFWASWLLIVLVTCAYVSTLMVLVFSCTPVRKAWDPLLPGKCHNSAAGYISGTINLISDIAVLLLPVIGIASLQMDRKKKAAVCAVFATGLIACGASALRLYYSYREANSDDKSYWLALVGLCGSVEIAMVIMCGCFTSFPRFLKWVKGERDESLPYASSQRYKSRSHGSESHSRLRSHELGKIGVSNEVHVVHDDWETLS
ncbi:hypothetical protein SVAN01_08401 [Stagonosporopsis vannaccii]|nr:hypothetical protein SVAN01_08401 [Stagonosporopsis vannaccii]